MRGSFVSEYYWASMNGKVQLAALWRQVAPPAFSDYLLGPDKWKSVQLNALQQQIAPPTFTDYKASTTGHLLNIGN